MFDNNKLGEIRPNQLITTFGPGSIVDAVKDSVTVLDLNYWNKHAYKGMRPQEYLCYKKSVAYKSSQRPDMRPICHL